MNVSQDIPLFVVGASRSGTTLLAAMLAAHSRMSCGTETRFFIHLARANISSLTDPASWPHSAIDFIYSIREENIPIPINYGLERKDIERYLAAHPPSVAAILGAVTEQHMKQTDKARWIEKTPLHVLYTDLIRRHFPSSPIIRIVRDPRDVALSNVKIPSAAQPRSYTAALLMWRECEEHSKNFFHHDPLSYTLRYEDLITEPERELAKLCLFINEPYEPSMLETSRSYSNVNGLKEPWKEKVAAPIDVSRIFAWQKTLPESKQIEAESLLGDMLDQYNYRHTHELAGLGIIYPLHALVQYPESAEWLVKHRLRLWPKNPKEKSLATTAYVGHPGANHWFSNTRTARLMQTLQLGQKIIREKLRGTPVHWLRKSGATSDHTGLFDQTLTFLLGTLAQQHALHLSKPEYLKWWHNTRHISRQIIK